jgi:hypothetical protein
MNQSKADSGILKINKLNKKCQSSASTTLAFSDWRFSSWAYHSADIAEAEGVRRD